MKILLEQYQAAWADAYLAERDIIRSALNRLHSTIEHIGSTAVPGLCAKPTIDILVGLEHEGLLDDTIAPMIATGYTYFRKYQSAMPYRRLFSRLEPLAGTSPPEIIDAGDEFIRGELYFPSANIHVIVRDTPHWHRHLAFRDFLRAHPDVRDEYGRLKQELSKREFRDTNDYNSAKEDFIQRTQSQALAWYNSRNR